MCEGSVFFFFFFFGGGGGLVMVVVVGGGGGSFPFGGKGWWRGGRQGVTLSKSVRSVSDA